MYILSSNIIKLLLKWLVLLILSHTNFASYIRSELMRLYQLTVPKDDAWNVMNEFGDHGLAMFIDLNKDESPYNLPYTK